jgi:hypothetical protein
VEIVWTNISKAADRIAGRTSRSVILRNTLRGGAPEPSAASSREASIDVNAATPMRNAIGVTWMDWTKTIPGNE